MDIILIEDLKNVGKFGEEKKVRAGYARNYLFPQGKALPATALNRAKFEAQKAQWQAEMNQRLTAAQQKAAEIEAVALEFCMRASDEGKLYGSIGTSEIVKAFQEKGIELGRQAVILSTGPIREIGEYEVSIRPHADVHCTIKVTVTADK